MSILGGGGRYKTRAWQAQAEANRIADYEAEQEFKQGVLADIRQARIARSQQEMSGLFAEGINVSGVSSGLSNISSVTASAVGRAYEQKENVDAYQAQVKAAQQAWKKYAKHQQSKATTVGTVTAVAGAVIGGVTGGPAGAVIGAQTGFKAGGAAANKDWGGTFSALMQGGVNYATMGGGTGTDSFQMTTQKNMGINTQSFAQNVGRKPTF